MVSSGPEGAALTFAVTSRAEPRILGRYELHEELASGGMATVHLGRLLGEVGFSRAVALKRLHEKYVKDPDFVSMFADEARLAARVRHPNVVPTLDVVVTQGELFLVMEYIHGESVFRLTKTLVERGEHIPLPIVSAIMTDMLEGLHAAHEAKSERGEPLGIVHRDVSPQNVLVGSDGISRVFDFGIAKAAVRLHSTEDGSLKGKFGYMSPEQLHNEPLDRRADLWAAGVVCWEILVGRRLFVADAPAAMMNRILTAEVPSPSAMGRPGHLDEVLRVALSKSTAQRFSTAREMAIGIERAVPPASNRTVAEWLHAVAGDSLRERGEKIARMESVGIPGRPSGATRVEVESLASAETRRSEPRPIVPSPLGPAFPSENAWRAAPSSGMLPPDQSGSGLPVMTAVPDAQAASGGWRAVAIGMFLALCLMAAVLGIVLRRALPVAAGTGTEEAAPVPVATPPTAATATPTSTPTSTSTPTVTPVAPVRNAAPSPIEVHAPREPARDSPSAKRPPPAPVRGSSAVPPKSPARGGASAGGSEFGAGPF